MGRLTLNVLLSFAQFEREVTAERIRDKIAASKSKGLWMGGTLPLGYDRHPDPQRRELIVNDPEAATIRTLFRLYAEHGNLRIVEAEASRLGLQPKPAAASSSRVRRAHPGFTRGQLHYLLTNKVYIGRIRHKDHDYPGQHPAIIELALWEEVQEKLRAASARPRGRGITATISRPLAGKLYDETGDHLTPTHTQRHGRRFVYYISHRLIAGGTDPSGWRLPAEAFEATVRSLVVAHLRDAAAGHRLLLHPDARQVLDLANRLAKMLHRIDAEPAMITEFIERGDIGGGALTLRLRPGPIAKALGVGPEDIAPDLLYLKRPMALRRRGIETRIIAGERTPAPDPVLVRVLAEAHSWAASLRAGVSLTELARRTGRSEPYLRVRLPLAFLSPRLQADILDGRQSPDLCVARLLREGIPLDWAAQERRFGQNTASL